MKLPAFILIISASFACANPFASIKSLSELMKSHGSEPLMKVSATSATALSGSQDPDLVGFWVLDSTISSIDTISDSLIFTYDFHIREEAYLASDGSFEVRSQDIVTSSTLMDTIEGRSLGQWATAGGKMFTQATSSVSWSSLNHTTTNDSLGGADTGSYSFVDGGKTKVEFLGSSLDSSSSDTIFFTKSGASANFTVPELTSSPILAQLPAARKSISYLPATPMPLFRYQNGYYRISGTRDRIPGSP